MTAYGGQLSVRIPDQDAAPDCLRAAEAELCAGAGPTSGRAALGRTKGPLQPRARWPHRGASPRPHPPLRDQPTLLRREGAAGSPRQTRGRRRRSQEGRFRSAPPAATCRETPVKITARSSLKKVAAVVSNALSGAGIRAVLTGGACSRQPTRAVTGLLPTITGRTDRVSRPPWRWPLDITSISTGHAPGAPAREQRRGSMSSSRKCARRELDVAADSPSAGALRGVRAARHLSSRLAPYPTPLPASSSNRVTAAVADEAPVPSRVTSPWTSSLPPPSRSRRWDHERMTSEVSERRALLPRQLVTTRNYRSVIEALRTGGVGPEVARGPGLRDLVAELATTVDLIEAEAP